MIVDSVYTRIGAGLWSWKPFRRLEHGQGDVVGRCAKLLWLALYTTPDAKRQVPGLFTGSVTAMADAAGLLPDEARGYLDRLIEDELVEYDVESRVLRMMVLPDCGEAPSNGNAIRGWWRRFKTVPECDIRDAHVATLRWILEEWSRCTGKKLSHSHVEAWSETFGQVQIPRSKRQTTKHVQADLFTASGSALPQKPEINRLETVREPLPERFANTPDPDQDQVISGSGESTTRAGSAPRLSLVPFPGSDADDLAELLAEATSSARSNPFPRALTKTQRFALQRTIDDLAGELEREGVKAALREYVERGMPGFDPPADQQTLAERVERSRGITPELVASPGWLPLAIQKATAWSREAAEKIALAAECRRELGFE